MAQRRDAAMRRIRILARRYGLAGGKGVWALCIALAAGCAVAWGCNAVPAGGLVVGRGDAKAVAEEGVAAGTEVAQAGQEGAAQPQGAPEEAPEEAPVCMVVHVDGAVANPGVYELYGQGLRINDAVESAGGLTSEADTSSVNLAAALSDGVKVHIPREGETPQDAQGMALADGSGAATATDTGSAQAGLVNINTADEAQLMSLPGVGEATAKAIVEDRDKNGAFASPEDLMRVSGIGEKKFAKMQGQVCV